MKTFREIKEEVNLAFLRSQNFSGPERGADGHQTFTNNESPEVQILLDLPANEWHLMLCGVVEKVGKISDNSLQTLLNKVNESDDLEKSKIYEPESGTYSISS